MYQIYHHTKASLKDRGSNRESKGNFKAQGTLSLAPSTQNAFISQTLQIDLDVSTQSTYFKKSSLLEDFHIVFHDKI